MPEEADGVDGANGANGTDETDAGREGTAVGPLETGAHPLAAVVETERTETVIESLRAEGCYDDSRRVRPAAEREAFVAVPITEPPTATRVHEVVRQVDPAYRTRTLADRLRERGWSEADLESAPSSWAVVGSVVLVRVPEGCPDERAVGEALLECHGEAASVLADEGIATDAAAGTTRQPRTRLLAGSRDTETVHTEHGTRYGLDPAAVMFSPGNQAERARMGDVVSDGERVFDMFAGIGYFTLPMARAGAQVTASEINPTAFRYLLENAVLNDVAGRVDAYRSDCRDLSVSADRVVMGYYGVPDGTDEAGHGTRREEAADFLAHALDALESGGVLHYHEATPETRLWERPLARLERAVDEAGRSLEVLEKHRVKSHSAGVWHVVVDARVE
ncbi:class I SAM-dependent methyltransferase [Natronobiforma cellulositropha]|uniref:class I SAM-dependent methyltransferase n=1 Tax=Natronobiforma cellulositropha TaxID=1679076 RepID=UPI0021D572B4|nr:class I SAM-dependent methyltransferase family protein [Natronobiforma cellulositropha]